MTSPSKAFVAKTASFATSAITSLTNVQTTVNGNKVDLLTDAQTAVEAHFIDGLQGEITLTFTDDSQATTLTVGTSGSLVVTFQQRADGTGAGATTKTITAAYATITQIGIGGATTGMNENTVSFACAGPGSTYPFAMS